MKNLFAKALSVIAAVVVSAAIASSANLSLLTGTSGCNEASQLLSCLNQVIQSINSGVGGLNNAQTAAVALPSTTTAEQTLQTYTLPSSTLATAGQSLRVTCWGTTGANANNKTMKLYFGGTSIATATAATNAKGWYLDYIVMRRTATTQGFLGRGVVDTTAVSPGVTDAAETLSGAIVIKCTGTAATASDITANGMIVESIK